MAVLATVRYILPMKRVIIVHGWASHPNDGWFPWIKNELETRGYTVEIPAMPHPMIPTVDAWVNALADTAGQIDENTIFIGHSIGCQTILRYLETVQTKICGAIFVAGFFRVEGLRSEMERRHALPWMEPLDMEKIRSIIPQSFAIFSDNDRFVSLEENSRMFEEQLGSKIIIEHEKKHFAGKQGINQLQSVLDAVLEISST